MKLEICEDGLRDESFKKYFFFDSFFIHIEK